MNATALLVAGASVRAAAWSARRAGFEPLAIDQFCDTDLLGCCRAVRVRDLVGVLRETVGGLVCCPWVYTGPMENYPELVDAISRDRPLWGNSGEVLRAVRDPWGVAAAFRDARISCPEVRHLGEALPAGRWMRKPLRSGGGRGIDEVASRGATFAVNVGSQRRRYYLQRYVPGPSFSAIFVAGPRRARLLGVTRQMTGATWCGAPRYGYTGSLFSPAFESVHRARFQRIGEVLVERFGLRGLFGVDAIATRSDLWPVEVNPRYTASVELIERATGVRAMALHVSACRGEEPAPFERERSSKCFGKAIVYAPCEATIGRRFETFVRAANSISASPRIADIPAVGECVEAGMPVVSVFAESGTVAGVRRSLRRLARLAVGQLSGIAEL